VTIERTKQQLFEAMLADNEQKETSEKEKKKKKE